MSITTLSDRDLETVLTRSWGRDPTGDAQLLEHLSRKGVRSPARSLLFIEALKEQARRLALREEATS